MPVGDQPRSGEREPHSLAASFAQIASRDGIVRIRLIGPSVSQREAPIINRALQAELKNVGASIREVVIDATEIRLMSSLALGMCIDARNTAARYQAETVIFGLNSELRKLFKLTKVDRLFSFVNCPDELHKRLAA